MNITILQSNLLTEREVPVSLISYLYNLGEDNGIALSGAIELSGGVFENLLDAVRTWYPGLYIIVNKVYVPFASPEVQRVLIAKNYSSDGVGLTRSDILAVTSLPNAIFKDNNKITSFNELLYFTGLTNIPHNAFNGCGSLTSITIPNSVTSIGYTAFSGCSGLTSITIGNSVTSIGPRAFDGCSSLTSVHISDIAAWCNIVFSNAYSNPLSCAHHLYLGEEEITDLVIPNSVTSIRTYAFLLCSGLRTVTIPNSVTSIGGSAFELCSGLRTVTIPNSVTSIGDSAFLHCYNLTSVAIETVTPPTLRGYVFNNTNNCPIYVPTESVSDYQSAEGWSTYASRILAIPNNP